MTGMPVAVATDHKRDGAHPPLAALHVSVVLAPDLARLVQRIGDG
jgi:hypothetical protein